MNSKRARMLLWLGVVVSALTATRVLAATIEQDYEKAVTESVAAPSVALALFQRVLDGTSREHRLHTLSLYGAGRAAVELGTPEGACVAVAYFNEYLNCARAESEKASRISRLLPETQARCSLGAERHAVAQTWAPASTTAPLAPTAQAPLPKRDRPTPGLPRSLMVGQIRFVWLAETTTRIGSPSGEQGRGSTEEAHEVSLTHSYLLQATEVTQAQWFAVMGSAPWAFGSCGGDCPVESVSWDEAAEYLNRRSRMEGLQPCFSFERGHARFVGLQCPGYRLPTEAEWEHAARAGQEELTERERFETGWYRLNAATAPHPVARLRPNGWGLNDMLGNVWEWTLDGFAPYTNAPALDPTGVEPGLMRVARGGAYLSGEWDVRFARRAPMRPDSRREFLGFRAARSVTD